MENGENEEEPIEFDRDFNDEEKELLNCKTLNLKEIFIA